MKKVFFVLLLFISVNLFAQISEGGLPPSLNNSMAKSKVQITTHSLSALDTATLLAWDAEHPTPMRYGIINDVSIDIKKQGTKTYLESYKGTIWQYRISAADAKSIQVIFEKYLVPDNAQLFIYDEHYSLIKGAFTSRNITEDLSFTVADFPGESVIIEYFEPEDSPFAGEVVIGGIGQAYVDINEVKSANADSYNLINVNCEEGVKWQDQKHAVCKITFDDGVYQYLCTGAFLNNTNNDGKPYFLTANHCISTTTVAGTTVAYFNYETAGCTNSSIYSSQTLSGAVLKTTGAGSDYTLLLFNGGSPINTSYMPYYAGWDVTGTVTDSTTGIHHPKGWTKKISVDHGPSASNTQEINWEGGSVSAVGTHWAVTFDEGTTYGGSSGSPLFDENQRVIGQLHGGGETDYYGKLSYSWTHPQGTYATVKSFLDPGNSGVKTLNAYIPSGVKPDPQFLSDFSTVCISSPIELTGFSAFTPTAWSWSFYPSSVTYLDGTSATSQNPVVSFNNAGPYDVSLTVTNSAGSSVRTVNDIITAGTSLEIKALPVDLADSCSCTFTGVNLQAYGADAYQWTLTGDAASNFTITNATANPVEIKPNSTLSSATSITLTLTGIQGTCSTALNYTLPLEYQGNDNIANAIDLTSGANGPFSNKCATRETGEPAPPATSCTGQLSWCDEYGTGDNLVEHSVWFTYTPQTSETVTITSSGFDNQIAVYRADTYSDVLSGAATLVAANDDKTSTDFNPSVVGMKLASHQKYWIQVDGSAGGATGTFSLSLSAINGIEDVTGESVNIKVYPQPACENVYIQSPEFAGASSVLVELYNASGAKVLTMSQTDGDATIELPLAGMSQGIYFARITFNDKRTTVKIVK